MVVPNPESFPFGWRRQAKFSFTLVNQIPGELSKLRGDIHIYSSLSSSEHLCHALFENDMAVRSSNLSIFQKLSTGLMRRTTPWVMIS